MAELTEKCHLLHFGGVFERFLLALSGGTMNERPRPGLESRLSLIADLGGVFAFISCVVAACLSGATFVISSFSEHKAFGLGVGLGLFAGVIISLLITTWFVVNRQVLRGYRILEATYDYRIAESESGVLRHSQLVKITIQATRIGVRYFNNKYNWTGHGPTQIRVVSRGHTLLGEAAEGEWKRYVVHLGRELRRNGKTTIMVEQELSDVGRRFQPFISKYIDERLKHLSLRVTVPSSRAPNAAHVSVLHGPPPDDREVDGHDVTFLADGDRNVFYEWQVHRPKHGRRYKMSWAGEHWTVINLNQEHSTVAAMGDPTSADALD